jgi:hypothetical protein
MAPAPEHAEYAAKPGPEWVFTLFSALAENCSAGRPAGEKVAVSKLWRAVAVLSLTAGLAMPGGWQAASAASTPPASLPTSPSTSPSVPTPLSVPVLTITASSALKPVQGDVLVVFAGGKYDAATVSGTITGAAAGDVVKLFAQPFPYRQPPVAARGSITLTQASGQYSFTVRPGIATRYQAEVFASATATSPVASSPVRMIYITSGGRLGRKHGCGSGPVCRPQYRFYVYLSPAQVKDYVSRHWFVYVGVKRAPKRVPGLPYWLHLDRHATVSQPKRITIRQYERTVGFTFRADRDAARWEILACAQDSEAKDGIGLPGRHSCGAQRVPRTIGYLG